MCNVKKINTPKEIYHCSFSQFFQCLSAHCFGFTAHDFLVLFESQCSHQRNFKYLGSSF